MVYVIKTNNWDRYCAVLVVFISNVGQNGSG